jgi:flagellar biogenesis protein FliO
VNFVGREALWFSSGRLRRWLIWLWERVLRISQKTPKGLRLCESLPLGDRRFVAVVEFERERFLVGGTPSSLVLLSRLENSRILAEDEKELEGPRSSGATAGKEQSKSPRGEKC